MSSHELFKDDPFSLLIGPSKGLREGGSSSHQPVLSRDVNSLGKETKVLFKHKLGNVQLFEVD